MSVVWACGHTESLESAGWKKCPSCMHQRIKELEAESDRKVREAVGCTYASMCTYAMNGKDITKVDFPEIAEGVLKALGVEY